jgi:hypothetical protein
MCHGRWMRRREQDAEEARRIWADFDRTTPIADPEPPPERPEPTRAEEPEEATAER